MEWKRADTIYIQDVKKREENIRPLIVSTSYKYLLNFLIESAEEIQFIIHESKRANFGSLQLWASALLQCATYIRKLNQDSFNYNATARCYYILIIYSIKKQKARSILIMI